jgi:CheY-like chemotaxis protein
MANTDDTAAVVLVVEDETLVRLLANDILTDAGYRVLEARDGQEALTILQVHADVRALVTDITMPNLDGLSLANIVRERWPHIGIILTSGAMPDGKKLELPDDAHFVPKPYLPEKLVGHVEAAIAEAADIPASAAAISLTSIPNLHAGQSHGAGGLAQPLPEPEE